MMEAVSSSETSVNIYQTTWRNIPEDSHLHVRICFVALCKSLGHIHRPKTGEQSIVSVFV
jgi:hypothetical protein